MNLKTRRILFIFCAVLFLTAAPAVILYTAGFRYSAEAKKIIQTGIIYLTVKPSEGIKIFADGKEVRENLITRGVIDKEYILNNLIPKSYNVKITRDGFWNWEKNLTVSKGLMTYASPLLLPREPKNELLVSGPSVQQSNHAVIWSPSPDFTKISYLSYAAGNASVVVKDLVSGKTQEKSLKETLGLADGAKIVWSPDSRNFALIFPDNPRRIVFASVKNETINLAESVLNSDLNNGVWSEKNDLFIYLSAKGEIFALNPNDLESARKITDSAAGFDLLNNDVYYLNSANPFIYKTHFDNPSVKEQVSFAPISFSAEKEAEIIISPQEKIAVVTGEKKLFILDNNGIPVYLDGGVEAAKFSQNDQDLLYNSDFEIFTYSVQNDSRQLVTRLSQKVKNVAWYNDYNHIWFANGNILKNIESDSRSSRNVYDFLNFASEPKQIFYDNVSNAVYYDQAENGKLSIYRVKAE